MVSANDSLKSKDAAAAVGSAQKAVDFYALPGGKSDEKLSSAQALLRKASIALADDKVRQAKELVKQRKFRTAAATAKEAEDLYAKFERTEKGKQQSLAVQEDAQAQLRAARTLPGSTSAPSAAPRPGDVRSPSQSPAPDEAPFSEDPPSPKAPSI